MPREKQSQAIGRPYKQLTLPLLQVFREVARSGSQAAAAVARLLSIRATTWPTKDGTASGDTSPRSILKDSSMENSNSATASGPGVGGISILLIPTDSRGFQRTQLRKMGWHASDTHGLTFTDCRVPADHLLGERGRGFANFLAILDDGRVAIAALAVGVIQCCLDECLRYAGERSAFGRPIGAYQAVAFKISDLAVMAATARHLTYHAAWLKDMGRPFKQEAAMAKLYATEAAVTATREATQIFGGYGFMDETLGSRQYRDSKILEIGEGTSEIQRMIIARGLGLPQ